MSDLTPITREEQFLDGNTELTPVTRQEMFIKKIYDASQEVPTPITREEMFLKKAADTVHGIEVESLRVTENGTYTAPAGKAYTPISVDVSTLTAETLNVISNGEYIAPSGKAYTPVNVNVPLPANAYLLEEITDGDLTSAKSKPLSSVSVAVTDADELDVFVGDSESVVSDNEPYIYRQSKGGRMVSERLVGASVAWNQLVENGNFASDSGWEPVGGSAVGTLQVENKKATLTIVSSNLSSGIYRPNSLSESVGNHVVLASAFITSSASTHVAYNMHNSTDGSSISALIPISANTRTDATRIWKVGARTTLSGFYVYVNRSQELSAGATVIVENVQLFDLTLMFGSTIADYVYSLEQSTAGSGIAWLKSYGFFTEDYYANDSGSLKSVQASEKKVRDASDNVIATYPLPSSDLRGLYKLSSDKLYCDGDIQYGDGWRLRRYGIVDLGTLTWFLSPGTTHTFVYILEGKKYPSDNILCAKYLTSGFRAIDANMASWEQSYDKILLTSTGSGRVVIVDSSYTDAATFKTAMSGVYLIYELATPTWEKTNPFTNPQTVGNTEEFVANLPVGHESKYYDGDIHHSYIYNGDARAKVTGDVDIVNGTAPNATCSVCVVMPDGDEIWSDAGDVTAEIWT